MKVDLGSNSFLFPMPVLMIATYGDDGEVDVMNMAWGGICAEHLVALNISESHKTSKNIKTRNAFTVSVADAAHVIEADYLGIASGNKVPDKFKRSGLHAVKSKNVDAPVVSEFPLTLECEVAELQYFEDEFRVIGRIVNVVADDSVLDDNGNVEPEKLDAIVFDTFKNGYYRIGEKIADAFEAGKSLMDK